MRSRLARWLEVRAGRWRRPGGPMRIFAHRGDSAHLPENTAVAFAAARDAGADGVELDVRLDADGEVVVFHDDSLERLCGRPGAIEALPASERRALRVGGEPVPTLAEALRAIGPLELDVELKTARPGRGGALAAATAALLRQQGVGERVIVSSFDPIALWQFRRHAPEIALGYLFHAKQRWPLRRGLPASIVGVAAVHPEDILVTPQALARWHGRGYAVNTWTVDDADQLRALAALGVDGACCNDPGAALRALGR